MNKLLNDGVVSVLNFPSMKLLLKLCKRMFSFLAIHDEPLMGEVSSPLQVASKWMGTYKDSSKMLTNTAFE